MPLKRSYTAAQALKLINQSEGRAGISGKGAHAVSRHLLQGTPGAGLWNPGAGTFDPKGASGTFVRDRFVNDPTDADGSYRKSSAWMGKGDMAVMLTDLLNSAIGQAALEALDAGADRVSVNYVNEGKLSRHFGGFKMRSGEIDHLYASKLQFKTTTLKDSLGKPVFVDPADKSKGVVKILKEVVKSQWRGYGMLKDRDVVGINAVLDKISGGTLHLQTLYPSMELSGSAAGYSLGTMKVTLSVQAGKIVKLVEPAS